MRPESREKLRQAVSETQAVLITPVRMAQRLRDKGLPHFAVFPVLFPVAFGLGAMNYGILPGLAAGSAFWIAEGIAFRKIVS